MRKERDYLQGLIDDPTKGEGTKNWARQRLENVNMILNGTEAEQQAGRDMLFWLDAREFLKHFIATSPHSGEVKWANDRLYLVDKIIDGTLGEKIWAKKRWGLLELLEHGTDGEKAWAMAELRKMDQVIPPVPPRASIVTYVDACSNAECLKVVNEVNKVAEIEFLRDKFENSCGHNPNLNSDCMDVYQRLYGGSFSDTEKSLTYEQVIPTSPTTTLNAAALAGYFLKGVYQGVKDYFSSWYDMLKNWRSTVDTFKELLSPLIDFVRGDTSALNILGKAFMGVASDFINRVKELLTGTVTAEIATAAGALVGGEVIGWMTGAIGKLDKIKEIGDKVRFWKKAINLIPCNCFTAGTKVLTQDGERSIEQVQLGDMVLAKNPDTGEMAYKEVDLLFQKEITESWNITVGSELITTTDEHPFWIHSKGWVVAKDLIVGDLFETSDGSYLAIDKIEVKEQHTTVYNFRVKDFHTYYVSNLKILTHNSNGICYKVGDLVDHELAHPDAHIVSRHTHWTDQELFDRATTGSVTASTGFPNIATAQRIVDATLSDSYNSTRITNWINSTNRGNLVLDYSTTTSYTGDIIGYGYERGATDLITDKKSYTNAKIVLKKDSNGGWYVLTGYPSK